MDGLTEAFGETVGAGVSDIVGATGDGGGVGSNIDGSRRSPDPAAIVLATTSTISAAASSMSERLRGVRQAPSAGELMVATDVPT